jgi:hypothetical protein
MSRLYYFASDSVLDEQPNPYVKLLSINQSYDNGKRRYENISSE